MLDEAKTTQSKETNSKLEDSQESLKLENPVVKRIKEIREQCNYFNNRLIKSSLNTNKEIMIGWSQIKQRLVNLRMLYGDWISCLEALMRKDFVQNNVFHRTLRMTRKKRQKRVKI